MKSQSVPQTANMNRPGTNQYNSRKLVTAQGRKQDEEHFPLPADSLVDYDDLKKN